MTIYHLTDQLIFPDPEEAEPEGILAVGGDLTAERLLLAYRKGIFPWYSAGQPILWWSPDPRLLLYLNEIHISKSLRRIIKSKRFEIRFDTNFDQVIKSCALIDRKTQDGTWITEQMRQAYGQLFKDGYAHSVESYFEGELVGGLYGLSIGKAFFGESMFSNKSEASKVALVALVEKLTLWDFQFIDCQVPTDHLKQMGAVEVERSMFLDQLKQASTAETIKGPWTLE